MPAKPDTPCSQCGKLLWRGTGSLPNPTCRDCRRAKPDYRRRRVPYVPKLRQCDQCGTTYTTTKDSNRYCSQPCRKTARLERNRIGDRRRYKGPPPRYCQQCGQPVPPKRNYCQACLKQRARERAREQARVSTTSPLKYGQCDWCGKLYIQRHRRRYCSDRCLELQHPARRKSTRIEYAYCPRCGTLFTRRATSNPRRYCTIRCGKAARKNHRFHLQRTTAKPGESIGLAQLEQRDGRRCHLCGKLTTKRRGNHPNAPSIDHLIPLSAGGAHEWANVALAHRQCNSVRRTTGDAQLLLIGRY